MYVKIRLCIWKRTQNTDKMLYFLLQHNGERRRWECWFVRAPQMVGVEHVFRGSPGPSVQQLNLQFDNHYCLFAARHRTESSTLRITPPCNWALLLWIPRPVAKPMAPRPMPSAVRSVAWASPTIALCVWPRRMASLPSELFLYISPIASNH